MIYKFKILYLIILFLSCGLTSVKSDENKILFKINNDIITTVDLINEIKYLKIFNKELNNVEQEKLYEISKKSIIREKLKKIELSKYFEKLEIERKYLENIISNFYQNNNFENLESFENFLLEKNLSIKFVQCRH